MPEIVKKSAENRAKWGLPPVVERWPVTRIEIFGCVDGLLFSLVGMVFMDSSDWTQLLAFRQRELTTSLLFTMQS